MSPLSLPSPLLPPPPLVLVLTGALWDAEPEPDEPELGEPLVRVTGRLAGAGAAGEPGEREVEPEFDEPELCEPLVRVVTGAADVGPPDETAAPDTPEAGETEPCEPLVRVVTPLEAEA